MEQKITSFPKLLDATRKNLQEYNYCKGTISGFDSVWRELTAFVEQNGSPPYTPAFGLNFLHQSIGYPFAPSKKLSRREKFTIRGVRLLNDFQEHQTISARILPDRVVWCDELDLLRSEFKEYSLEKAHSVGTIRTQMQAVDRFLKIIVVAGGVQLNEVTPQAISKFVASLTEYSQATVRAKLVALRFFFKFLYEKEHIAEDLSNYVPYVQGAKAERVPSTLGEEDLRKLLSVIDRGSPIGKRNYAILVIAAMLGIRDSDITNLTFDNLDWENSRIEFVQCKTGEPLSLPLLPAVGEAVIDYMKHGRPITKCNHVFVKHKAPFDKAVTFYDVMARNMSAAGIKTHVNALRGLHVLRHTLASGLIKQGAAYTTVSAILGHVNSSSTDAYIHIDIDGLLKCALGLNEAMTNE